MSVFKYADDIEWSLPLFFECEYAFEAIKQTLEEKNLDMTIKANFFGAPACLWSGGRSCPAVDLKTIEKNFQKVCDLGACPTLTFTNTNITKDILNDNEANYILDVALAYNARFIVVSEKLKNYIKNKKSDACVLASVIQATLKFQGKKNKNKTFEDETKFYNKLLKEYNVVVVRPEYSRYFLPDNPTALDDISRIEALINQACIRDCPKAPEHIKFIAENNQKKQWREFVCIQKEFQDNNIPYEHGLIHSDETINKLVDIGVRRLKLQGRRHPPIKIFRILLSHLFERNDNYQSLCSAIAVKFMKSYMMSKHVTINQ